MPYESFRMTRVELRDVFNKYEAATQEDAYNLLRPNVAERLLMGAAMVEERADNVRNARDANKRFVDAVVNDLPDFCSLEQETPLRPVAEFRIPGGEAAPALPSSSYGSMASVFLHLLRDWSTKCDHVKVSTYQPAIDELRALLPNGGDVLVPGCGLGRLALELAAEGYRVEANDASRLFLTFADYVLNRAPAEPGAIYPLAHIFSENWGPDGQYLKISTPEPHPAGLLARARGSDGTVEPIRIVPGDFAKTYAKGCAGHRKFDAIVTCFFIDTAGDVAELFNIMDGILAEGGVWVNVGPLNWRKEARLKLSMAEIIRIWQGLGYDFVSEKRMDCDYHLPRGEKMYTESYNCALTAAVKRRSGA